MAYSSSVAQSATNTSDFWDKLHTFLVTTLGWTVHDDQRVGSDYIVYKSVGEDASETIYIWIGTGVADKMHFKAYGYWNAATHAGVREAYNVSYNYMNVDDDSAFVYWLYGDKDAVFMVTKVSAVYTTKYIGIPSRTWSSDKATTANAETAGSGVVIEVDTTAPFTQDEYYIIHDDAEMERIQITAINAGVSVTATIANSYAAGAKIGEDPQPSFISHYNLIEASHCYVTNKFDGWASAAGQPAIVYPAVATNAFTTSVSMERYPQRRLIFDLLLTHVLAACNEIRGSMKNVYTTYYTGISSEDTITIGGTTYDCFNVGSKGIVIPRTV